MPSRYSSVSVFHTASHPNRDLGLFERTRLLAAGPLGVGARYRTRPASFQWLGRCRIGIGPSISARLYSFLRTDAVKYLLVARLVWSGGIKQRVRLGKDNEILINGGLGLKHARVTFADLPTPGIKRWVVRRKAMIVVAVRAGLLSMSEACERYTLSVDEFLAWDRAFDAAGLSGLRAARVRVGLKLGRCRKSSRIIKVTQSVTVNGLITARGEDGVEESKAVKFERSHDLTAGWHRPRLLKDPDDANDRRQTVSPRCCDPRNL